MNWRNYALVHKFIFSRIDRHLEIQLVNHCECRNHLVSKCRVVNNDLLSIMNSRLSYLRCFQCKFIAELASARGSASRQVNLDLYRSTSWCNKETIIYVDLWNYRATVLWLTFWYSNYLFYVLYDTALHFYCFVSIGNFKKKAYIDSWRDFIGHISNYK